MQTPLGTWAAIVCGYFWLGIRSTWVLLGGKVKVLLKLFILNTCFSVQISFTRIKNKKRIDNAISKRKVVAYEMYPFEN